ncbi:MAG: flavin reductase [Oscillospiraceae bacterium]|nr:flavin reductase [Oscillospiraceae bacterium]
MHCLKKVTDDLIWVGANDRRLAMFEGVYSVPRGVSYNSYLLIDEKTVLFDTVDKAVRQRFLENLAEALGGRRLDYLVVQHVEPDHASVVCELAEKYPEMKLVGNAKTLAFVNQFNDFDFSSRFLAVTETDALETGRHKLNFVMAPMVHWPEVMVTYDSAGKILFSADAFGSFGALNGALFSDEVDFERDYMDEARRYYANIVGKYGEQAKSILEKASALDIKLICPLHGFVWRKNFKDIISKYARWSRYEPERQGVMIAYASIYGNTENAAEILASNLRGFGINTEMYDVSVTPASEIVSAAFKWSHLVFASPTYNAGIFISMEELVNDLAAHNIQNRTVAIIENGSWAAASGTLIRAKLEKCKNMNIIGDALNIKSGVKAKQLSDIAALAEAIAGTFPKPKAGRAVPGAGGEIDAETMHRLSYGLFVLSARADGLDNGCIINTAAQITSSPLCVSISVSKANHTHDMLQKSGEFNLSVLTEGTPFEAIKRFGFQSGRDADKFAGCGDARTANGIRYLPDCSNSVISAKVTGSYDCGTHTVFFAEVTQAFAVSDEPSVTYRYYFDHIKPDPAPKTDKKSGYVCKICGYVREGEELPDDFICPICKHGAGDFAKL